jgi:tetratricopeptide (TPR) repeat protein
MTRHLLSASTFMKASLALLSLSFLGPSGFAQSNRVAEANDLFRTGDGSGAASVYSQLIEEVTAAENPSDASRETLKASIAGLIRVGMRYGQHEEVEERIAQGLREFPDSVDILTLAGTYAAYRGRHVEALQTWERAILIDPLSAVEARYRLIRLNESVSIDPDRKSTYEWFTQAYEKGELTDPKDFSWVGRAYVQLQKYEWDGAQKVYQEILDASVDHEPGIIAKADLWLDRYDEATAIEILQEVLQVNPESVDAALSMAAAYMEMGSLAQGKKAVDAVLFLNPHEPTALSILADILFYDEEKEEAFGCLERGYETNPISIPLLAIEAAYALKQRDREKLAEIEAKVTENYGNAAEFHFRVAKCLERNYLFSEADGYYLKCLSDHPGEKRTIASRAILRSRISPASVETALEPMREAFQQDPFHVRLFNMRNLFEKRAGFDVAESEHFKIRFPPDRKEVYGDIAIAALEKDYADYAAANPYRPEGKILVEFFEDPNDFSMRISGLPGAGLSGVCFGDIVIIQAPQQTGHGNTFNWGNVVRHELAHVFSLGLSERRIPRWYTEGLSVAEEWDPGIQADPLLRERLKQNDLIEVAEMDAAFHRPTGPQTVWLVYAMSGVAVRYLVDRFGPEIKNQLLRAFSTGAFTQTVLPEVTGLSLEEIDRGIKNRIARRLGYEEDSTPVQAAGWSVQETTPEDLTPREKLLKDIASAQGEQNWEEGLQLTEEWLKTHPEDIEILEWRAVVAYRAGEVRLARVIADEILEASDESYRANVVLAWLDRDNRRWDRAVEHFLTAHELRPRNIAPGSPIREAEDILREERDWSRLSEVLAKRLAMQPTDDAAYRELAEIAWEGMNLEVMKEAVRQAMFIDPFQVETQILWGKALLEEGRKEEAMERFHVASTLAPLSGKPHLALAEALVESGSTEGAIENARKALDLDPTLVEARDILEGRPRF